MTGGNKARSWLPGHNSRPATSILTLSAARDWAAAEINLGAIVGYGYGGVHDLLCCEVE